MPAFRIAALLAVATVAPCSGQIAPQYAENVTVYHLNPASAGAIPLNMDTGDARGDLYFYLGQFLLPLECANATDKGRAHFDCDNPERVDPNLVVTKVNMEIDSRNTNYSACNLCNGTDPFTGKACKVGTYLCDCFTRGEGACDATKVGHESIKDHFTPHKSKPTCAAALTKDCGSVQTSEARCGLCILFHKKALSQASCEQADFFDFCPSQFGHCTKDSPAWQCWSENIPRKTGGYWFSTLAEGQCNKTSPDSSCGWKILSTTTVQNKCLKDKIMTHVETASPSCFKSCGARNVTSSCWVSCFFDTVLGPQAAHSSSVDLGGLPIAEVEKVWSDAFLPEAQGGCAPVEVPVSWMSAYDTLVV